MRPGNRSDLGTSCLLPQNNQPDLAPLKWVIVPAPAVCNSALEGQQGRSGAWRRGATEADWAQGMVIVLIGRSVGKEINGRAQKAKDDQIKLFEFQA